LIWVTGNWKQRRALAVGFAGTLALLMAAGEAILPGWLSEFVQALIAYRHYVRVSSLLDFYLTPHIAKPVAIVLLSALLVFCFRWRKSPVEHPAFFFRFALVLAIPVIALPVLPPFNQVLLLPSVLIVLLMWNQLWNRGKLVRLACCAAAAFLLSSWLVATAFATIYLAAPALSLKGVWAWPFLLSFAVPPIITGLLVVALQDLSTSAQFAEQAHPA
jgi:hypothetical protein